MEQVSMNDGLDGRETVAFGLTPAEVGVLVLGLMGAYAALHTTLPAGVAWGLALVLAGTGAALAWGRVAGRPLLEWTVLLARFAVRTRHLRVAHGRELLTRLRVAMAGRDGQRALTEQPAAGPARPSDVVIPLPLRPHRAASPPAPAVPLRRTQTAHAVAFFSLNGGTGRTTLAVELAGMLAVRARAAAPAGAGGSRAAVLDLALRSPAVALRLGIRAAPAGRDATPAPATVVHSSGLVVHPWAPAATTVAAAVETVEAAGAAIVVIDIDCDLGDRCLAVLQRCQAIYVTLTPTTGGVLDAYRSTAVLRRLGLRDRIGYVVNRGRGAVDLSEPMADLGGRIIAEVPEHGAFVEAENGHHLAALTAPATIAPALLPLVEAVEHGATRAALGSVDVAGHRAG